MCIVCVEYGKGKMTPDEGLRALKEVRKTLEPEHSAEVYNELLRDWWDEWDDWEWENMPQTD